MLLCTWLGWSVNFSFSYFHVQPFTFSIAQLEEKNKTFDFELNRLKVKVLGALNITFISTLYRENALSFNNTYLYCGYLSERKNTFYFKGTSFKVNVHGFVKGNSYWHYILRTFFTYDYADWNNCYMEKKRKHIFILRSPG